MNARRLSQFYHELSVLIAAGVPLHRALEGLGKQQRGAVAEMAWDLYDYIEVGSSLSEAAKAYGSPFTAMQVNLMAAGEQSGRLAEQLDNLSETIEAQRKLRMGLIAGMVYPVIVLHIGAALSSVVAIFNADMVTAGKYLLYSLGPLYAVAIAAYLVATVGRRIGAVDYMLDWLAWYFPVVRGIARNLALARFTRTFGALAEAGSSAAKTLEMASQACGNRVMRGRLASALGPVKRGEDMGQALVATGAFNPTVNSMFITGVEGGRLPEMMAHITRTSEHDAAHAMKILNVVLPLLCFLVVVGYVAFTIISMLGGYWRMLQDALGDG